MMSHGTKLVTWVTAVGVCSLVGLGATSPSARGTRGQAQAAQRGSLQDSLIAREKQSWDAWQRRDGHWYQADLADDHVEIGAGGPSSKAAVVATVGSPMCVVTSYAVSNFTVTVFDSSAALVTYRAEQDTHCGGAAVPSPAWTSSLYIKRNGKWLNALFQQTPVSGK